MAATTLSFTITPADAERFDTQSIAALRHDFDRHPLMQLPALAELARDLAATKQCRFIAPGTTQSSAFDHKPRHPEGREIDEVFRRIEEPGSWIALYNVERNPRYRPFLEEVIEPVRARVEREQGRIFDVNGFIFISAPPSVTPFHIDRENNFWLQVRGRKTLSVWRHTDRTVVPARDVEEFIVFGSLDRVRMKDGFLERSLKFDVGPGEGVYFPSTSPHATRTTADWVRPGDGVSVSIGVVFYTEATRRAAHVHLANHYLRKLGLAPAAPGTSALEGAKVALGRALLWAKRRFRGYHPQQGY